MNSSIKIILYQQRPIGHIPENDKNLIIAARPDFVCLSEYFFVRSKNSDHLAEASYTKDNIETIRQLSIEVDTCLIGGSLVEKTGDRYFNTCYTFDRGKFVGSYSKIHLFHGEVRQQMSPGTEHRAFDVGGVKIGLLICADVLVEESFLAMRKFNCDIIFVPTTSPRKVESPEDKLSRDERIFVRGAQISRAYIAKCCTVESVFLAQLQARSLVASPEKIIQRVPFTDEDKPMIMEETVSLDWIRNFKNESE